MRYELKKLNLVLENAELKLAELKEKVIDLKSPIFYTKESLDAALNDETFYKNILEEKEKVIEETEKFSNVGRWSFDFETMEWSAETYRIFEYPEDFKGTLQDYYLSCIDEITLSRLEEQGRLLKLSHEGRVMNQTIITPSGNKKLLTFSSAPIFNDADEIIGVEGLVKDISENIVGINGLENFFNLSYDLHCIVHLDMYFVKVSPAWSTLLGYSEKELLSHSFLDFIHPDDREESTITSNIIENWDSTRSFENRYIKKSGEVVHLSWNTRLDRETHIAYCTVIDITKSKKEQDELLSKLSSKDLLLREIHHRVKNNLQIISSLLSLQSGANSKEKHLVKLYQDCQNRIKSMAAIHEMFYQSEQLDKIEFGKYIKKLIDDLSNTFSTKDNSIKFSMNVEPVYVNLDTAIPLGLIINEVVTNSIKHGGDEKGNVKILIKMETIEGGRLLMTIGDTGVNSVKNVLNSSDESLGVLLINSLVEQIDGEIKQMDNSEGTTFQFIFSDRSVF
ncbi:PAS domain S-box protein [Brumimicrobium glaciale]|uniref:histidine kinase n=1 Tax=Brumimicrobium glaciale TaxID=200475 RepID=A0A4Q4KNI6_9FLAO|nr:histidine kinase dimerization/phosphoacceptor domain -containing protein [Brumimicrobium glaciale]RYM35013.1 PAS domain S-box protein [Brumimicrobium glaciale]